MNRPKIFSGITRNVAILGAVSFLTDVSSEMIYPLLPTFLAVTLGAGPAFLGLIEGAAESVAAFLKLVSGLWSDRVRDRSKLILLGYGLSAFSRPLVCVAGNAFHVLVIRVSDRIGKGIRSSPRDAIIADSVDAGIRGRAYGFHRSMDHAGAVTGPLIATALLATVVHDLRTLFLLAAIPGVLSAVLVWVGVREVSGRSIPVKDNPLRLTPPRGMLRSYLVILFLFTLGGATDAFLLLRAGQLGVPVAMLPLLWTLFHVVKMIAVMPLGALSDRLGRRNMIVCGWAVLISTNVGFMFAGAVWHAWVLLAFYGLFYGFTEGTERALLADLAAPTERGSAFGWYHFIIGMTMLPASFLFGLLWQRFGAPVAFGFDAALAALALALLLIFIPARIGKPAPGAADGRTPAVTQEPERD